MARHRPTSLGPATSFVLSLMIHLALGVVLVATVATSAGPRAIEHPASTPPPPELDPAEVLGIEESQADTLTWIGYEEYEKHLARLSEVEQAAMSANPSSGGGGGAPAASGGATASSSPPPLPGAAQPSPAPATATAPSPPTDEPERLIDKVFRDTPQTNRSADPQESTRPSPTESPTDRESDTPDESTKPAEEKTPRPTEDDPPKTPKDSESPAKDAKEEKSEPTEKPTADPGPTPTPTPTPTPNPEPSPKPNPTPTDEPSETDGDEPGEGPGEPVPEPGNDSNKDAEATSTIQTPEANWRNGRPLAAEGLEIKTRRLAIPLVTWFKLRPTRDPVAEIRFKASGRPASAELVVSSGDRDLDGYITDALFRWRASGKRLEALSGEETALVRLRLIRGN